MNPVEKNYLKELLEYIGLDLRMDDKESEYSIICDAEGIAYARVRDAVITSMTVFRWKKNTRSRMRYSEPMVFGYSLKGLKAWIR